MSRSVSVLVFCLVATACSSDAGTDPDDPNDPGGATAAFTAMIDGAPWAALASTAHVSGSPGGLFVISGSRPVPLTGIGITLFNINGTGTYPLGVGSTVYGGGASFYVDGAQWITPESGVAGSITLTRVAADHLTGTFSFSAVPVLTPNAPARSVTQGSFDLPVTALGGVAVQDFQGSRISGTIGGAPWNAASVLTERVGQQNRLNVLAINTASTLELLISQYAGVGSYSMNTLTRRLFVSSAGRYWGGADSLSTGTVTVTSSTSTRVRGSFTGSLRSPNNVNGTIAVSGAFDLGLPNP